MALTRRLLVDHFVRQVQHPVTIDELAESLSLAAGERTRLLQIIRVLLRSGELIRIKGGRLGLPRRLNLVVGRLGCSPKGYGFVSPVRGGGRDVFVRFQNMAGALHGDEVVARVEHRKKDGRLSGSIIRVLRRANQRLLGRYEQGTHYGRVAPIEPKLLTHVLIAAEAARGAREGQIVEVEIEEFPGPMREASGRVLEVIGEVEDPAIDLELVLRRAELPRRFPGDVERAARVVAREPSGDDVRGRTDFRSDTVVTIDGESARDFDDAVSAERLADGGFRLQVHIADVSHYVTEGDRIDEEARSRATSVYFPDHVIPMLPEALSNEVCSLKPDVDRLTMSLVVELDADGAVQSRKFHEGVIRSAARLTYNVVHRILVEEDEELRQSHQHLLEMLESLRALAAVLQARRRERGSLDFDLPESEIVLGVAGEMTGIRRAPRLMSHNIIEELMILANEVVAQHFIEEDLPCLYRVHETPEAGDVEQLNESLALFGYEVDVHSPKSFRELMERVRGRPEERFVNTVALRTMKLARYQPVNLGHFGLASAAYTHFTSPIRRYPDLVVHRRLREWLRGPGLDEARREGLRVELDVVAEQCSRLERKAEDAEREYVERKKARFMADRIGQRFRGVITAVEAFGFFVELEDYFVEGLVHLTSLADDYYRHDEAGHALVGEHLGRTFRLGNEVEVVVSHVDLLRRQIDFVLAGAVDNEEPPVERRRGSRRRPDRSAKR